MFLIDDVLFFPVRSLVWIFREIHHAAEKDKASEPAAITAKLSELYMLLETGQMTEAEFDAAERALLDRLDVLEAESDGAVEESDVDDADDGAEDHDEVDTAAAETRSEGRTDP